MDLTQLAPSIAIVTVLKRQKHRRANVGYLASQIGKTPSEVEGYVKKLEKEGAVHQEQEMVILNEE